MQAVLNAALPIFALILLGWVCGHRRILPQGATDSLNGFVVWLALPAVLFQAMATITRAEIGQPGFFIAMVGGIVGTFGLAFLLDRRQPRTLVDTSIEGLGACYANAGFMGLPLCLAVFGPEGLPPAVLAMLLTACVLFACTIAMIELGLQQGSSPWRTLGRVAWQLARNPLVAAPALGLAWSVTGLALPLPVLRFTTLLGASASPCALVTIGLFLARPQATQARPGLADPRTTWRLVGLKLLVQPAITGVLALLVFRMPPLWAHAAVLLSALPIGTGPFMLAKLYEREAGTMSRAILFSTLLSVLTVSGLVAWMGPS